MRNAIYPPEPVSCPPEPHESYDDKAEAEVHYLRHDSPMAAFAADLSEAMAFEDLTQLALVLRNGTAGMVREEIERMFDSYWSRIVKARLLAEREESRRYAG